MYYVLHFCFFLALAKERSLAIDVLVHPLDVTEYNLHKDHVQAVMNHFQRVGIDLSIPMLTVCVAAKSNVGLCLLVTDGTLTQSEAKYDKISIHKTKKTVQNSNNNNLQ